MRVFTFFLLVIAYSSSIFSQTLKSKFTEDIARLRLYNESRKTDCIELADSLFNICQECDDSAKNEVLIAKLRCDYFFNRSDHLIKDLSIALNSAKKLQNNAQIAEVSELLYVLFKLNNELDEAEKFAFKAEKHAALAKDTTMWLLMLNNLANVTSNRSSDSALRIYQKIEKVASSNMLHKEALITAQFNTATIHAMNSRLDSAMRIYNKMLDSKSHQTDFDLHLIYYNRGYCLFELGEPNAAIEDLRKALNLLDTTSSKSLLETTETLAYIFLESQQYDSAATYYQRAYDLQSELYNVESAQEVARLREELEAEQREFDIQQLEAQNEVQRLQKQLFIGLSLALFLILGVAFAMYRSRLINQRLKANQRIERLEKEKEVLSLQTILFAQEEERQRIARDLHDGIGALLSTAKMHINNIEDELEQIASLKVVKSTKSIIESATSEVRRVAHNMMPGVLMKLGLEEGLDEFFESVSQSQSITVHYVYDELPKRLDNKQEIMLYRMLQEMTNNTLKHAKASEIRVMLKVVENTLEVTYKDDGIGFYQVLINDPNSFGLAGIKSRAEFIGATIQLDTAPNKGVFYSIKLAI